LLRTIGAELATFYDLFIQMHGIPIISKDGKSGGIALLGWSSGCTFTLASLAQIASLQADTRARMSCRIRALILEGKSDYHIMIYYHLNLHMFLQDTAPHMLGLPEPLPPKIWTEPFEDFSVPEDKRFASFTQWASGYFSHGDLGVRSTNVLSYTDFEASSVSGIDPKIINPDALTDRPFSGLCQSELREMLHNAVLNKSSRGMLFPQMKVWVIAGERTVPMCIACLWALEDLDKELGGGLVKGRFIKDVNHFVSMVYPHQLQIGDVYNIILTSAAQMHWDYPELTIHALLNCL
jgi:hypothetical protein